MNKILVTLMVLISFCSSAQVDSTLLRATVQGQPYLMLNDKQEDLILTKLTFKQIYQNEAQTFYLASLQLHEKTVAMQKLIDGLERDITLCEQEALDKNQKMIDYQNRFNQEAQANDILRDEKMLLKRKLTKSVITNVGLGIGLGGAVYYIITH